MSNTLNMNYAYYGLVFLLPASGLFLDIGVSMPFWKIILILLLPFLLTYWLENRMLDGVQALLFGFLAYMFFVGITSNFTVIEEGGLNSNLREELRWLIQYVSLVFNISILFLTIKYVKSTNECIKVVMIFIYAACLLSILGIIQWILIQFAGVSILGIARDGLFGGFQQSWFLVNGMQVYRANSLCREPKDLAVVVVIAMFLLYLLGRMHLVKNKPWMLLLLFICLILTFATTGFVLLALGLIFIFGILPLLDVRENKKRSILTNVILGAGLILVVGFLSSFELAESLIEGRLLNRMMMEEYDALTYFYLFEHPWDAVIGLGAGMLPFYANDYLPTDPVFGYMYNYTWDAKSGFLKSVASYGIIGTLILIGVIISISMRLRFVMRRVEDSDNMATFFLISLWFVLAVHSLRAIDDFFWLFPGLALAYAKASEKKILPVKGYVF